MLNLNEKNNVFVEITNEVHGGREWGLGRCLWSPSQDSSGKDAWKVMKEPMHGDYVVHAVRMTQTALKKDEEYYFIGASRVAWECVETTLGPEEPGRWESDSYYRIELTDFLKFDSVIKVNKFLEDNKVVLDKYTKSFYAYIEKKEKYKVAEKYLSLLPGELFKLLLESVNRENFLSQGNAEKNESTENEENRYPHKKPCIYQRTVRDSELVRKLKIEYDNKCQICGETIKLPAPDGYKSYSEGHHVQPLGAPHIGPDIRGNVMILCPSHHVEFDYGAIAIHPLTGLIEHIDYENKYHHKDLKYKRPDLDKEYIQYHYDVIFKHGNK